VSRDSVLYMGMIVNREETVVGDHHVDVTSTHFVNTNHFFFKGHYFFVFLRARGTKLWCAELSTEEIYFEKRQV
jgi:hypothetical protein